MRLVEFFLCLSILVPVFLFDARHISAYEKNAIEIEEYAVYSALIQKECVDAGIQKAVIESEISGHSTSDRKNIKDQLLWTMSELEDETVDDYVLKSKKHHTLKRLFEISTQYSLINEKEREELFKKAGEGWKAFHQKYSESSRLLSFSAIGFNQKINQALVFMSVSCGSLCGEGTWYLLAKENRVWKICRTYTSIRS
jgi:hypothetical protein